ncbi:MAG TPA: 23S rRNA (adenine(2503)-C(2))-methyltransferase RlmN [Thermoanaerobaculia bacterium]|nr:23S rRNA (adenine(2503)-C(2))-methyltransferase RlmN [Thermoanaerobaculia bacterium]
MTELSWEALGMTPAGWEALVEEWGLPRYRGRQIFDALHRQGVREYSAMRVLPKDLRERLARELPITPPEIVRREPSSDGSVKYGLRLPDGALIEAVFMPGEAGCAAVNEFEDARAAPAGAASPRSKVQRPNGREETDRTERFTVCLSSQTGCAVDCVFCVTGRLGAGRNLTAAEIVGQLYAVLDDVGRDAEGLRVVFMGMGEPFLNPDGVLGALEVLFEQISPRRVTVSTSGITPAFERLAALPRRPNLAVSLNAADEETRAKIMPITRTYPLAGLLAAMRRWPLESRRRITVEYVLIAGVNDSPDDAARLARLLRRIPVKVNVIPLNEDPVYLPGWKRPDESTIDRFVERLAREHLTATVRRSRGSDASAACGQLKGRTEDPRGHFKFQVSSSRKPLSRL